MRQWSPKQYLRGQLDLIDWLGEQDAKDRKTKNSDASGHHAKSAPLQAQKAPRRKARSAPKVRAKTTRQAVTLSSACQLFRARQRGGKALARKLEAELGRK